jgi:hypothetical protein
MLVRLLYISYASTEISDSEMQVILAQSKANNYANRVTGVLIHANSYFFQCLEGERRDVNQTYLKISTDRRHSGCLLLEYREVDSRLFPTWSMTQVNFDGPNNSLVLKYSENGLFEPFRFSASQANALLCEVAEIVSAANRASEKQKSLLTWFKPK